eukprot:scaffold36070_cov17-Tisochrysis_lutea.AAC.2
MSYKKVGFLSNIERPSMLLQRFSCPALPHRRHQQRLNDPLKPKPFVKLSRGRLLHVQASSSASIQPALKEAAAFAPATVANLGPGYDWMGCAVEVCPCLMLWLGQDIAVERTYLQKKQAVCYMSRQIDATIRGMHLLSTVQHL